MIIRSISPQQHTRRHIQGKYAFERRLFKVLVIMTVLTICVYVYSLSSVIYGVVERRALEKEIAVITSDIGVLEAAYLLETNTITYNSAVVLGYTKPETLHYESQERVAFKDTEDKRNGL
jgi:hypothetical protein